MAAAYDHANLRGSRHSTGPDGTAAGGTHARFLLSGAKAVRAAATGSREPGQADVVNPATGARTLTRRYVPGAAIDERLAEIYARAGAACFLHTGRQDSVVAISDAAGNPVARRGRWAYRAYGPDGMIAWRSDAARNSGRQGPQLKRPGNSTISTHVRARPWI